VTLVWAVPVVAAAVATVIVAGLGRPLADEVAALRDAVRRLGELRPRLAAVRAQTAESAALADAYRRRHGAEPDDTGGDGWGSDGSGGGGGPTTRGDDSGA
jgi:hypothetical protein